MLRTTVDGLHGIGYGSKELRCACGTPYSEYCKNCDIIGRHALGLIASSQSGALHGSILSRDANEHYLETSFSNEDEPTADAMTVTPTSQRGSALPVTDGIKCPGFVGYLDDAHCATLVRDASTGDFLVGVRWVLAAALDRTVWRCRLHVLMGLTPLRVGTAALQLPSGFWCCPFVNMWVRDCS
eukprot:m.1333535 g.1333535  ORF g.1333535 m.1333535 type:complete len:184 (+) comp24871_c0_seq8:2438-2989(+)